MARMAWAVRENARILDDTMVGCALMTASGKFYAGCNIEHSIKSHDIHAEINAISSMVAGGELKFVAIVVVSHREFLTPCGACTDWIMELGGPECQIGVQTKHHKGLVFYRASDLMPHYPR